MRDGTVVDGGCTRVGEMRPTRHRHAFAPSPLPWTAPGDPRSLMRLLRSAVGKRHVFEMRLTQSTTRTCTRWWGQRNQGGSGAAAASIAPVSSTTRGAPSAQGFWRNCYGMNLVDRGLIAVASSLGDLPATGLRKVAHELAPKLGS